MTTFQPVDEQMKVLMRGVDFGDSQTYVNMEQELRKRLEKSVAANQPLRVYCGFDPSTPDLHIGHTIPMRKLRQFQDLGHEVFFLIGTFTGIIGDPSDRDSVRKQQTVEEAIEKGKTYADQAFRVLDRKRTQVVYNHEWLGKLTFTDVIRLAGNFTAQQFLARDNFSKRQQRNDPIWLHEFFYTLMQGYDPVALKTDIQIGGTDQLFNLMAGRKLMEAHGMVPQTILTFPLLVGTDGVQKMSKSLGNFISIDEAPGVIYTKTLNVPDSAVRSYAELVTRWGQDHVDDQFAQIEAGTLEMRAFKHRLAHEIVGIFHGDAAAAGAGDDARRMHQGDAPSDAPSYTLSEPAGILAILADSGLVKSRGEARRLIQQGGVRINGEKITDIELKISIAAEEECVVQAGKRKFLRIVAA